MNAKSRKRPTSNVQRKTRPPFVGRWTFFHVLQPIPFPLAVQRARVDTENLGGLLDGDGGSQDAAEVLGFHLLQSASPSYLDPGAGRCADLGRHIRQADRRPGCEYHAALHSIAQLADVAWPGVAEQCRPRLVREA